MRRCPYRLSLSPIADFKEKLRHSDVLLGTTLTFTDPTAADALADTFDFIWIDQEHTAINPEWDLSGALGHLGQLEN